MSEVIFVVEQDSLLDGLDWLASKTGIEPHVVDPDDPTSGGGVLVVEPDDPTSGDTPLLRARDLPSRLDDLFFERETLDIIVIEPTRTLDVRRLVGIVNQAKEASVVVRFHVLEAEPES